MLKKIVGSVIALVMLIISLCSCNYANLRGFTDDQIDQDEASAQMKKILADLFDSVKNNDGQLFDTFFADHIISMPDFEKGKSCVFDTYKGDLINIECKLPMGTGDDITPGEHIFYAFTTFDIISSVGEYKAYIEFYTKDSGTQYKIRKFKLLEKQAWDNGESFNDCTQRYGVYYPGWIGD